MSKKFNVKKYQNMTEAELLALPEAEQKELIIWGMSEVLKSKPAKMKKRAPNRFAHQGHQDAPG